MKSEFLKVMQERGLFNQCTDMEALDALMSKGPITAYCGFDPTADSLHIGNLVPITMLRWLQKTGHKPIVLVGGATGRVGDPSFKDSARQLMSEDQIDHNLKGIKRDLQKFIQFGKDKTDALMVDNWDWFKAIKYMDFLREYGSLFSVNRMLSFDSVKIRLDREQSLSFLEFNYMVLQAYDFLELFRTHKCRLQLAGADQWGNVINGVDLIRKKESTEAYGLTAALITDSTGKKFGKSEGNAIWLDAEKCSPYDYYQFWRNVHDADVGKLLRIFTELSIPEIEKLEKLKDAEINEAKKILAYEATKICHGDELAKKAHETAKQTFEEGKLGKDLPTIHLDAQTTFSPIEILVTAGLVKSKGEAKRLIDGGGAYINDEPISVEMASEATTLADFQGKQFKLSAGRKHHVIVTAAAATTSEKNHLSPHFNKGKTSD